MLIGALFASSLAQADVVDAAHPAPTQWSDTLHPFVLTSFTHDDNLLRLPDNGSDAGYSDNYTTVQAGVLFDRPVGRQLISGWLKASKVTFDRFDQLNYTGKDAKVDWGWVLGDHLHGNIGTTYEQTLAPFSDFHTDEQNLRVDKAAYANGTWQFHPSWQVHAGFNRDKFTYGQIADQVNNRTEDTTDGGVDYLASSNSRVGLLLRHIKGSYPQQQALGGIAVDNGYTQNEIDLNVNWSFSGVTQIIFVGGRVKREHNALTARDDTGTNGRLIGVWAPTGKLRFTGMVWREFAATETTFINSALNKGESLDAGWEFTPKLSLDVMAKHEKRDFNALSGVTLPPNSSDSTNTGSVALTYKPVPSIALVLTGFHESRSGSEAAFTNSYRSNGVSFSASAQF
jgi:exopolysaccharide biosynthesis operon protein EpsL